MERCSRSRRPWCWSKATPTFRRRRKYFEESPTHTTCRWKGLCSYYTVVVNGERNVDAAWYYPDTKPEANHIKGMVAFWRGVKVEQ
jgi:uncharacterized protein (DUF427 family)